MKRIHRIESTQPLTFTNSCRPLEGSCKRFLSESNQPPFYILIKAIVSTESTFVGAVLLSILLFFPRVRFLDSPFPPRTSKRDIYLITEAFVSEMKQALEKERWLKKEIYI